MGSDDELKAIALLRREPLQSHFTLDSKEAINKFYFGT